MNKKSSKDNAKVLTHKKKVAVHMSYTFPSYGNDTFPVIKGLKKRMIIPNNPMAGLFPEPSRQKRVIPFGNRTLCLSSAHWQRRRYNGDGDKEVGPPLWNNNRRVLGGNGLKR